MISWGLPFSYRTYSSFVSRWSELPWSCRESLQSGCLFLFGTAPSLRLISRAAWRWWRRQKRQLWSCPFCLWSPALPLAAVEGSWPLRWFASTFWLLRLELGLVWKLGSWDHRLIPHSSWWDSLEHGHHDFVSAGLSGARSCFHSRSCWWHLRSYLFRWGSLTCLRLSLTSKGHAWGHFWIRFGAWCTLGSTGAGISSGVTVTSCLSSLLARRRENMPPCYSGSG